jgi:preprotein translocase subunit SecB
MKNITQKKQQLHMKHLLQKTKRRLLWVFALVFALGISTQVQAQTITEGFEETQWNGIGSANGSATVTSYVDGTNATLNTGTWRINSACTVSRISSNTASSRTWTVNSGERAVYLMSESGAYIMTPLLPNGVTSVKYWVRTHSSGGTPTVFMATNTTITGNTGSMSTTATGAWYGSIRSTIHSSLGWTSVSFNITGNATSAPCYLKFARTSSAMVIDDIEITTPETTIKLSTPSVAAGPTTATNQGFTAQWADVSNESSYTVKVYKSSDNSLAATESGIAANSTSKAITGLSANTSYYYKVTAIGDGTTYSDSDASANSSAIRTLSTAKAITAFTIAGVEATINGTDITAEIPYSSSWTQTPEVSVSQYADYSPKTAQDFSSEVEYTVTAEDGSQQVYTVNISKAAVSQACDITDFSIAGQISSDIDGLNVTIVMPYGTNVTALTPTIDISPAASVAPLSGVEQDFSSPVEYTVTAEDGTTQTVYTVTVTNATGSSACDITGFTFTDQVGSTVIRNDSIFITMPAGTMRYGLTPASITLSDYATVSPLATAAQDFRSAVVYTVTAQNGSSQKQYTVTVTNEPAAPSTLTWLTSSASYSSGSTGYEVANVGTYYKATSGGTATVNTGLTDCHGSTSTIQMGSSLFIFKALADITSITLYGNSGTGSSRTLSAVATSSTLGGTYTALSPSASASGNLSGSQATNVCSPSPMTITFNSTITAGTFFRVTLSGNAYIAAIDLATTSGSSTTQLTAPTVGSASDRTNQGFTANWSDVSNEIGYTVNVYQGASLVKTIEDIAANATSVEVTGLDANTSYTYKVMAIGEGDVYTDSNESSASASVRTKSTAKDITAFTIAGVQATIEGLAITAEVPYSTNLTSLTPSVTVSQYAEYSPSGAQDFSSDVEYTVTAEDGSQKVYTVSLTKAEASGACDITDFSISGQISSDIDGLNITVLMPYGSTVSSLTPTVETSLAASYGPSGAQNFSSPVEYTVTAENGINEKVYTVTVSIAEPTINACAGPFNFTTTGWSASDVQYFTLTGSNLVADISVSVDAPFQVSNDNATWNTTTTIAKSGFTASGDIYIRYNPTSSSTGIDSGTILFSTTGADNSAIALEGTAAAAINNPSNKNQAVKQGVAIENIVFTVTGGVSQATCIGLPAGVTFDDETYTISGTPTTDVYDAYPYTVTIQGLGDTEDAVQTGTITVKDPNAITVAYICNTTTLALASDALYQHLNSHLNFEVTAIGEASIGATKSAIESNLAAYDVVVLSESTTGSNANIIATEGISKPMVNGKHFVCGGTDDNTARWQWAKANNGTVKTCTVTVTNTSHPVFAGLTLTDGTTTLVNYGMADNKAVGYIYDMTFTGATTLAYSEGSASKIAIQEVPVGTTYETGKQTTHKYVMIAVNNLSYQALTADGLKLYDNAIKYVASAQNLSDAFRSTADGTWTSPSAWESTSNGTTFATGVITPTANASAVTIANNITVPTTSSIQAPAILSIEPTGKLTVADDGQDYGTLTIPTGGKLIIESNDTATAQVKNDGEVVNNGTIVIRKTLTASKGWYFVSFPFDVDSTKVLIAGTDTQATWGGPVDEDYDFYVAEYDAERRDAEGAPNYTGTGNYWKAVSPKVLVKNRGYIIGADVDITLDFVSGVSPTTTMFSATAEEDLVSYATNSANIHHSWNLMGIPFGSAFNFNNASQDQAPFYFHDGTQYVTIMDDDGYEAYPYTAFFLQRNPGATVPAKLSFASAGRTLKSLAVNRFDEVSLVVKNAKYSDKVRIRLQEDASAGYEIGKDAVKFFATKVEVPQIYSKQGNYVLSVNSVPVTTTEVSVTVKAGEEGNYTIAMEDIAKAVGCKQVILKDGNVETDLLADNEYTFSATAGASKNFTVLFVTDNTTAVKTTEGSAIIIKTIGDKAYVSGLEGLADVCVYDVSGKLVQRFTNVNNNDALTLKQLGIYVVDVKTATQQGKAKVSVNK